MRQHAAATEQQLRAEVEECSMREAAARADAVTVTANAERLQRQVASMTEALDEEVARSEATLAERDAFWKQEVGMWVGYGHGNIGWAG